MPRGNYWEATYDPEWDGPTASVPLDQLEGTTGFHRRKVVNPDGAQPHTVHWLTASPPRSFQDCDISVALANSLVSNCTFIRCRFRHSTWTDVKFSNCVFEKCDFSRASFLRCVFVSDCQFKQNTASGELFRIEETAISTKAFMGGLETNLAHLPATTTDAYQKYRFTGTRQKIAKLLYSATINEADVEYYFEAYEELVRSTLTFRVERHRFHGRQLRSWWYFLLLSLPSRAERSLLVLSGALTNWGRGILRAALFALGVLLLFTILYTLFPADPHVPTVELIGDSFLASLNITLVAGYTAYFEPDQGALLPLLQTLNMVLGLFWYSLMVPVLARRILR